MERSQQKLKTALARAVANVDRRAVREVSEAFVDDIRTSNRSLSKKDAHDVLAQLRGMRQFDLMQRVADALIQSGQDSFTIRRQYAQSLLDRGNITAGIDVLNKLAKDTKGKDRREHNEVQGLLGRAYKQLYMDAQTAQSEWVVNALKSSIKHYFKAYKDDPKNLWHGINTVALLQRARRDCVRVTGYPNAKNLAAQILKTIERKKSPATWDLAAAAEAYIGLEQYDNALRWVNLYVKDRDLTAFHLGSFERQLRETWGMHPDAAPGSRILPIIRAELLSREGGTVDIATAEIQAASSQQSTDELQLQKILGRTGVQSYRWWLTGLERARGVARIGFEIDRGQGTGFLVRGSDLNEKFPSDLLLMTNAHVVSDDPAVAAMRPDEVVITFEALDATAQEYEVDDVLFSSPPGELDTTLLRLNKKVELANAFPLHPRLPTANKSRVYVIGHPQGGTLSFSVQDNLLIDYKGSKLHYRAPTEPGSSGSAVFNSQWKLIGIHHAGGDNIKKLTGTGTYAANEGIWIESIRKAIAATVK